MDFSRLRVNEIDKAAARQLADLLRGSRHAIVLTGAGISTESGIPDFRSPGGIWKQMPPIEFRDFVSSAEMRREAWRRRFALKGTFAKAKPNAGHVAIAELVDRAIVKNVITQNIDNLHQMSGVPAECVIELHGNTSYAGCLSCGTRLELEVIREYFELHDEPPNCRECGGLIKTATISFGQAMPEAQMKRAEHATRACDLFLAVGSSLVVYPAAGFPLMAKRAGAKLAIVNREPTELDGFADLVLHAELGPMLTSLVQSIA